MNSSPAWVKLWDYVVPVPGALLKKKGGVKLYLNIQGNYEKLQTLSMFCIEFKLWKNYEI